MKFINIKFPIQDDVEKKKAFKERILPCHCKKAKPFSKDPSESK